MGICQRERRTDPSYRTLPSALRMSISETCAGLHASPYVQSISGELPCHAQCIYGASVDRVPSPQLRARLAKRLGKFRTSTSTREARVRRKHYRVPTICSSPIFLATLVRFTLDEYHCHVCLSRSWKRPQKVVFPAPTMYAILFSSLSSMLTASP